MTTAASYIEAKWRMLALIAFVPADLIVWAMVHPWA